MTDQNITVAKVVVAGDAAVGKTSLVRRYVEGKFSTSRVATIGVDFYVHTVDTPQGKVKLSIWDMAGQKRFAFMRDRFYKGSCAAAIVFDLSRPETAQSLPAWKQEVLAGERAQHILIVGNKSDLVPPETHKWGARVASSLGGRYLVTSALSGEGVAQLFWELAVLALDSLHKRG